MVRRSTVHGTQSLRFATGSVSGALFRTGSDWAIMRTADNSSPGDPLNERNRRASLRLRSVAELFPEIIDASLDNDGEPSCSCVEALDRQEPSVNSTLAQHALALLARLFRFGKISYHGCFVNLASGLSSVLRIDSQCWKRTRRLNHAATPTQRQEEGLNGRANQGRTDGTDRRA